MRRRTLIGTSWSLWRRWTLLLLNPALQVVHQKMLWKWLDQYFRYKSNFSLSSGREWCSSANVVPCLQTLSTCTWTSRSWLSSSWFLRLWSVNTRLVIPCGGLDTMPHLLQTTPANGLCEKERQTRIILAVSQSVSLSVRLENSCYSSPSVCPSR